MASLLSLGEFSLCLDQPFLGSSQEIRIIGIILIGSNIQTVHSKIQPKEFLRYYEEYLVFVLHQNTDVIFP